MPGGATLWVGNGGKQLGERHCLFVHFLLQFGSLGFGNLRIFFYGRQFCPRHHWSHGRRRGQF